MDEHKYNKTNTNFSINNIVCGSQTQTKNYLKAVDIYHCHRVFYALVEHMAIFQTRVNVLQL